jgi:putative copper export protein
MDPFITWIVRSVHIFGAAVWLGGYALLLLVIVPALAREDSASLRRLAVSATRWLSAAGGLTVLAGLVLIWRTRGYGYLLMGGEWGGIVITSFVLAIVLGAIGDAGLRPAIRRLDADPPGSMRAVRRWTLAGLIVGALILLMMTRAIYAK